MRIRRCASRLLGSASAPTPAPPGFELPPPAPPPPAHESHAGFVAASGTSLEPCEINRSPWDLMGQLHPSDPQEEELFLETYFVAVAWRTSWLFQPSMPAISIKEEEEEQKEDDADMVDGVIFELRVAAARKKYETKPKTNNKVKAEDDTTGRETPVWACKRNSGKGWFCRRPVSQPDSFCPYHADYKAPRGGTKPRKRAAAYAGEGFYYYAGFGPSRSKRHRVSSSSDAVPEPPPAGRKEEMALLEEEKHIDFTADEAQADGVVHQPAASACVEDNPRCDGTTGIAGCDEESSDDDDVVEPRDIKTKSPMKKRWRKPVKARSLKSLMY